MDAFGVEDAELEARLQAVRRLVAQPTPEVDPAPALVGDGLFVGNKYHAANVEQLLRLGVTAVLNCAPSGIQSLPLDLYRAHGIEYANTNVAQDDEGYPILHGRDGACSEHLRVAMAFYGRVWRSGGTALFFCVAGQNRSATLAVAVQVAAGKSLEGVLGVCAKARPFIIENRGFQRQLVELEALLRRDRPTLPSGGERPARKRSREAPFEDAEHVEVELLVPGLRTFDVVIPVPSTIEAVRQILIQRVDEHLAAEDAGRAVGKAWLVFTTFGVGSAYDLILEEAAVEARVQQARLQTTYGLEVLGDLRRPGCRVRWCPDCRFELVIFSLLRPGSQQHEAFKFRHRERPGARGTLLAESILETHLRAWDFTTGEAFWSTQPIVFSFSDDPRSRRDFMNISTSANEPQQFNAPGEGGILGVGNNAIVHHVELEAARRSPEPATAQLAPGLLETHSSSDMLDDRHWDAAAKRPLSLPKMLASLGSKSEAGMAKRLRMAGALNKQGRLLYFYGLGIALASNNSEHEEYKFEATLLSQYQEDFSAYTMKRFLEDYMTDLARTDLEAGERRRIASLQAQFSLIKVKILLVSLLNGFRDLTLMGVQAFDFNHLDNVLISRDRRACELARAACPTAAMRMFCTGSGVRNRRSET